MSVVTVVAALVGSFYAGALGAAWGFALASIAGFLKWWHTLRMQPLTLDVKPEGQPTEESEIP